MRIGFVAPMKAPDHAVPSGDRQMARLLGEALVLAGHRVEVLTRHRSFLAAPDPSRDAVFADAAAAEVDRLSTFMQEPAARPDVILAYHLHYKAPDRVGAPLARNLRLPYLTAEASYARKRDSGPWRARQAEVAMAVRTAAVNLCFTANDKEGLAGIAAPGSLVDLPPFIDATRFPAPERSRRPSIGLVAVAMMRPGDKLASYRFLAAALSRLADADWHLAIVGDGPMRSEVEALFAGLADRVRFLGRLDEDAVARQLGSADLFVWPGFNEAFGLCYLEAQACGLPVVAIAGEGTPSVIRAGETGVLTPPDVDAYAAAIRTLLDDASLRQTLGMSSARFVHDERSLPGASRRLDAALHLALRRYREIAHV